MSPHGRYETHSALVNFFTDIFGLSPKRVGPVLVKKVSGKRLYSWSSSQPKSRKRLARVLGAEIFWEQGLSHAQIANMKR